MPQRRPLLLLRQRNVLTPPIQKHQNYAILKSERTMSAQGFLLDLPILDKLLACHRVQVLSFTMMRAALIHPQSAHLQLQYLVTGQRIVTTLGLVTWTSPSQPRQSRKPAIISTIDLRGSSPWMSSSFSKEQQFSLMLLTLQPTFLGHFTYQPTWIRVHGEKATWFYWLILSVVFIFKKFKHFNILLFNGLLIELQL